MTGLGTLWIGHKNALGRRVRKNGERKWAKVYYANLHSSFEGWFVLFTLPLTLLEGWMSFWKGESHLKKVESPSKRVSHPSKGWTKTYNLLNVFIHPLEVWFALKGEYVHPSRRVNELLERWITPQKGWIAMKSELKKGKSTFLRVNKNIK